MNRLLIYFAILLVLLPLEVAYTQDLQLNTEPKQIEPKIDALVAQYQALDIFSGVVLVAKQGDPIYHKAFGLANRQENRTNTIHTLFDIGSMNKTFTKIVIQQLIAEGKLQLSSPLSNFITGFQAPDASLITVEHLLNHESGFGDYHSPDYFDAPKSERSLSAIVARAKKMPLLFKPGTEAEYSNTGYVLLGAIIEKVTGKSYFDVVRNRIVKPLGLKNTYLQNIERVADQRAKGYFKTASGKLMMNDYFMDEPNPDGGFLSNIEDVLKFYRSYYYDEVLLNENMKKEDPLFQFLRSLAPGKAPMHAGGYEGFNTAMYQIFSEDISIIVFANMDEPVAERLGTGILAIVRGQEPDIARLPATQAIYQAYQEKGTDFVKSNFSELSINFHPDDPKDWILNMVGYTMLQEGDVADAIQIFKLNTVLFPEEANCWDSYGEALRKKGYNKEALAAYQKALELDPDLESAKVAVTELKR